MRRISFGISIIILCLSLFCGVAFADSPSDLLSDQDPEYINSEVFKEKEVTVELKANPVTPNNSNGFHSVLLTLLGNYEPVTVDYTYTSGGSSYTSHNITTDPDWSWICSAAIFGLVIFCTFRFIGGIFRHD